MRGSFSPENLKPEFNNFSGRTRWLVRSMPSAISPSAQAERKGRRGNDRRPVQCVGEFFRKVLVADGVRRDDIHGAAEFAVCQGQTNGLNDVFKSYPRHPLRAASDLSSNAKFKGQRHFRERAISFVQNNSKAREHHAGAKFLGAQCFGFPIFCEFS